MTRAAGHEGAGEASGRINLRLRPLLGAVLWATAWSLLVAPACPPPVPPAPCPAGSLAFYQGQVLNEAGGGVVGAKVRVAPSNSPGSNASLFSDALGQTVLANPVVTDQFGRYAFWVVPGSYDLEITYGTVDRAIVNVGILDPRKAHTTQGSNFQPPLRLSESSTAAPFGNAAIILERLNAAGQRTYGPWLLHVNKGTSGDLADLRWLYNVDWDETRQIATTFATTDVALSMHLAPRGPVTPWNTRNFSFTYDYAPPGSPRDLPQWTTLFATGEAAIPGIATLAITKVNGTGQRPFVVGDGLAGQSLLARRDGWICYNTAAPAGVLTRLDEVPLLSCPWGGLNSVCECTNQSACDATHPCPGDVVVPTSVNGVLGARWSTLAAQRDASVYMKIGNGTWPSVLSVGKALVKIETGASIAAGDIVVSSGMEPGRAKRDNTVTDPRRIIGFALEDANATRTGYVAVVRVSR
jgi:hypothetical protein